MSSPLVQLALLIRRGQLKLEHVSPAEQPAVRAILHQMTDAQESMIAQRQCAPRRWLGRSRVFTTASS